MNQDANEVLRQAVIMASSLLPPWVMVPMCTTTIPLVLSFSFRS